MRGATTLLETGLSGYAFLAEPLLNKGTPFTEVERAAFDLYRLLLPKIGMLEVQVLLTFSAALLRNALAR